MSRSSCWSRASLVNNAKRREMKDDPRKLGIGGAPTRATTLPKDSAGRKAHPVASGFLDYFPDAAVAISHLSYLATLQHHADKPMHWDRAKSKDEADTMMRHFLQRGTLDEDGQRHTAKMAWRALALLQKEIEQEAKVEIKQYTDFDNVLAAEKKKAVEQVELLCRCSGVRMEAKDGVDYINKKLDEMQNTTLGATPNIKDGPYCEDCGKLADLRVELSESDPLQYFCNRCIECRPIVYANCATAMEKL